MLDPGLFQLDPFLSVLAALAWKGPHGSSSATLCTEAGVSADRSLSRASSHQQKRVTTSLGSFFLCPPVLDVKRLFLIKVGFGGP